MIRRNVLLVLTAIAAAAAIWGTSVAVEAEVTHPQPTVAPRIFEATGLELGTVRGVRQTYDGVTNTPTRASSAVHPFWDVSNHSWTIAANLKSGDQLLSDNGSLVTFAGLTSWTGAQWMWDLTVANMHAIFVVAGSSSVLVHNCGGPEDQWHQGTFDSPAENMNYHLARSGLPGQSAEDFTNDATNFRFNQLQRASIREMAAGISASTRDLKAAYTRGEGRSLAFWYGPH